jgi:hypothetical protein
MKKLGLTFAAVGLFFATAAQAQDIEQNTKTTETTESTDMSKDMSKSDDQTNDNKTGVYDNGMNTDDHNTGLKAGQNDGFEMVEVAELPEAVSTAISTDYQGATTKEAYVKEKDGKMIYKIKLDVNGVEKKVYTDADGIWIKKEDKKKESY